MELSVEVSLMGVVYKPLDPEKEGAEDLRILLEKLLSKPSPGSAGKTGAWRLYKPKILIDKCIKCGICWLYCPEDTIAWPFRGLPSIDYDYCKGCGICANVCPVNAIEMILEGE